MSSDDEIRVRRQEENEMTKSRAKLAERGGG
jgi:hypothetical protein